MPPRYDEPLLPSTPRRGKKKKEYTLDSLLAAAKALGVSIVVPTSLEESAKQSTSREKLGIKEPSSEQSEPEKKPAFLKPLVFTLHATHVIGGVSYGPGEVTLEPHQRDLQRSLLQQDQACVAAHMDISQFNPVSHCFLIKNGNGLDRHNKFRKQRVTEAEFNSDSTFLGEVTITAGQYDIAGYQPSFNPEGRSF